MTSAPQQGYVHISVRNAQRRAERVRAYREADESRLRAVPSDETLAPENGVAPVHMETEARGFVLYVGMDEQSALAAGTSLTRLANELRHYVETRAPGAESYAAGAISPELAAAPAPVSTRQPGVLIDLARREVLLDGEPLNLTYKEFELLNYLVENGGRTVNREELLQTLWDETEEVPNERTIDVHI